MILDDTSAALYTTMNGGTALTALLASTTSVYDTQAPDVAALPFVVFSHQGGGPDNLAPVNLESNLWYVRAYSASGMKAASEIMTQIDALLHRKALAITGNTTFWCNREENIKLVENLPNGGKIWSAGGIYRIRTAAT